MNHILLKLPCKNWKSEGAIGDIKIFITVLIKAALLLINKAVETDIKTVDEELVMVLSLG